MQQKQVGNFFKEKLDPKELTPSCLSQELSRFPGVFLIFVFKRILQFHSYSDGANPLTHGAGEKEENRSSCQVPPRQDGHGCRGSLPGTAGQAER